MATVNQYYGMRVGPGESGYDGLTKRVFTGVGSAMPGLTFYYLSCAGWVEDNDLLLDMHSWGTVAIDEGTARRIATERFGQPLEVPIAPRPGDR